MRGDLSVSEFCGRALGVNDNRNRKPKKIYLLELTGVKKGSVDFFNGLAAENIMAPAAVCFLWTKIPPIRG